MQNLTLQVLWLDNSLGLAINKKTKTGNLPITSYYFWPVSDAWEQIRAELESKPWVTVEERLKFLNLIVDVMNHWQKYRNIETEEASKLKKELMLNEIKVIGIP